MGQFAETYLSQGLKRPVLVHDDPRVALGGKLWTGSVPGVMIAVLSTVVGSRCMLVKNEHPPAVDKEPGPRVQIHDEGLAYKLSSVVSFLSNSRAPSPLGTRFVGSGLGCRLPSRKDVGASELPVRRGRVVGVGEGGSWGVSATPWRV